MQLLADRNGSPQFATAANIVTGAYPKFACKGGLIGLIDGTKGGEQPFMSLPYCPIQAESWTTLPSWRFVDGLQQNAVGCVDAATERFVLHRFPDGGELFRLDHVLSIDDYLSIDGDVTFLLRMKSSVAIVVVQRNMNITSTGAEVPLGSELLTSCLAPRPVDRQPAALALVVAADKSVGILELKAKAGAEESTPTPILVKGLNSGQLRLVASRLGSDVFIGIGDPQFDGGVGRMVVMQMREKPTLLFDSSTGENQRSGPFNYGQCAAFLGDVNGDSVPELCVTSPWGPCPSIDIVSGATGETLKSWWPNALAGSAGHWISIDSAANRVLVGGANGRGDPENLSKPGQTWLLSLPALLVLNRWDLPSTLWPPQ